MMLLSPDATLFIAALLFAAALGSFVRRQRTKRWPTVQAKVIDCELRKVVRVWAGNPSGGDVRYAVTAVYSVRGVEHTARLALQAPAGSVLTLHYNPTNPADVIERPTTLWFSATLLLSAILMLLAGIAGGYRTA